MIGLFGGGVPVIPGLASNPMDSPDRYVNHFNVVFQKPGATYPLQLPTVTAKGQAGWQEVVLSLEKKIRALLKLIEDRDLDMRDHAEVMKQCRTQVEGLAEANRSNVAMSQHNFEETKKAQLLMGKVAGGLGGLAGLTLGSGITYLATRGKKRPADSAQAAKKRKRASSAGNKRPRKAKAKAKAKARK
jgi:hypothetical protein